VYFRPLTISVVVPAFVMREHRDWRRRSTNTKGLPSVSPCVL